MGPLGGVLSAVGRCRAPVRRWPRQPHVHAPPQSLCSSPESTDLAFPVRPNASPKLSKVQTQPAPTPKKPPVEERMQECLLASRACQPHNLPPRDPQDAHSTRACSHPNI